MSTSPNILFIVLDTARAKTVLPNLNSGLMPTVSQLADQGITFNNAMTTAPWTLPSHASLFTGQYTSDHDTHAGTKYFDPDVPTLAELLSENGYSTVGISGNIWVSPEFGFDRGFDQFSMKYDYLWGGADLSEITQKDSNFERFLSFINTLRSSGSVTRTIINAVWANTIANRYDDGARRTTDRAIDWIDRNYSESTPFFFFINYLEPHLEYNPPDEFANDYLSKGISMDEANRVNQDPWEYVAGDVEMEQSEFQVLEELYKGELAYLDNQLERIISRLNSLNIMDETMIIIVGDHGENIGDHELMDHQYCLYDTLLHVPLIIRYPDEFNEGDEHDGLVEIRDLYPTILDVAGVNELPESSSMNSLLNIKKDSTRNSTIAEYLLPQPSLEELQKSVENFDSSAQKYDHSLRSIRTKKWKLIENGEKEIKLYDMESPNEETNDLSQKNPDVVRKLQDQLHKRLGKFKTENDYGNKISSSSKQRLEDLGYLQ